MDEQVLSAQRKVSSNDTFTYVSRKEWGARTPRNEGELLNYTFPLPFVVLTYTNSSPCTSMEECKKRVFTVQTIDMYDEGLRDIKYNWLVGHDGNIYEGLGWAMAASWNDPRHDPYRLNSVTFAYIEDMTGEGPTPKTLEAMRVLATEGVRKRYIQFPLNHVRLYAKDDQHLENETKENP